VPYLAATDVLETIKVIVICIFLVILEFLGVALIVAPRAVARKVMSTLRSLAKRLTGPDTDSRSDRRPAHPSGDGS
jgi:hypothetical protein